MGKKDDRQLELPLAGQPKLRVIQGLGQKQHEALASRDAVARVLIEAGVDVLLRRMTPARAEAIEGEVDEVLRLFDRVDACPALMPVLKKKLDDLEALVRETRERVAQQGRRTR